MVNVDIDLDEDDFEILRRLDRDGDIDVGALSDELGVSTSTIYYRLEKYREKGIIKGEVPVIDGRKLGLDLTAISEITSTYGPGYEDTGERLGEISGVRTVYFMVGEMSFIVIAHLRDHQHLQEYIDDIMHTEAVEHSATHIVLETFKDEPRLLVNYDEADLTALFD